MAVVTFDVSGPGLFINEIDTGGDNELDLDEIYSEWKDWSRTSDNLKYPPAFRQVGADPLSATQNLGTTYFLNTGDGWRIRPAERDHLLQINGNLYTDPSGDDPIAPTLGAYTVLVRMSVSSLTEATLVQSPKVDAIHALLGLDTGETLTIVPPVPGGAAGSQTLSVAGIVLQVSEATGGTVTVTRTA